MQENKHFQIDCRCNHYWPSKLKLLQYAMMLRMLISNWVGENLQFFISIVFFYRYGNGHVLIELSIYVFSIFVFFYRSLFKCMHKYWFCNACCKTIAELKILKTDVLYFVTAEAFACFLKIIIMAKLAKYIENCLCFYCLYLQNRLYLIYGRFWWLYYACFDCFF